MSVKLMAEARKHFNEPVLVAGELARCVGYAEDGEDCYLIVQYMRPRGISWVSMVGGYVWLRCLENQEVITIRSTSEEWNDYKRLDSLLELNGAPKEPTFLVEISDETQGSV